MSLGNSSGSVLLKVSQVPDWERRAIRLSLGLVFFTSLGLTLWAVPGEQQQQQQLCTGLQGEKRKAVKHAASVAVAAAAQSF
jgi:hypothetical protein